MGYYDLPVEERTALSKKIEDNILDDIQRDNFDQMIVYFSDRDTYIRKIAYQSIGRIYFSHIDLKHRIINALENIISHPNHLIRQTTVYSLGEIGKFEAEAIFDLLEIALADEHHTVINAVVGALKQMGQKNPQPTLTFIQNHLCDTNPIIRREMIHGMELHGREHPEDILPLLKSVEYEKDRRVRSMIVHVIGQISYKKGCLEKVLNQLIEWDNKELVKEALDEIVQVHKKYENFSELTVQQVKFMIDGFFSRDSSKDI